MYQQTQKKELIIYKNYKKITENKKNNNGRQL